jgi:hypothetical protein
VLGEVISEREANLDTVSDRFRRGLTAPGAGLGCTRRRPGLQPREFLRLLQGTRAERDAVHGNGGALDDDGHLMAILRFSVFGVAWLGSAAAGLAGGAAAIPASCLVTRMRIASTPARVSADAFSRPAGSCSRYATSGDRLGTVAAVIGSVCSIPYLEQIERDRDTDHTGDARYVRRMFGYGRADRCINRGGCSAG